MLKYILSFLLVCGLFGSLYGYEKEDVGGPFGPAYSEWYQDKLNNMDYMFKFRTVSIGVVRIERDTKAIRTADLTFYDKNGVEQLHLKCTGEWNDQRVFCTYKPLKKLQTSERE